MANTLAINLIARTKTFSRKMKGAKKTLRRFSNSVSNTFSKMARMAKYGAIIGAGLAGYGMKQAVKTYADFEQQLAMVSTMLGEQAMQLLPMYAQQLKRMAVSFGESTATLSKGLYDILSASFAPSKALKMLGVATKAAKAGLTDTGVAADAITTLLNAYGISADKAGDVSDKLFAIVKRGKTTFAELAPNIGKVASMAAIGGVNINEFGAAIATMTRAGMPTEIALTSLRSLITQFLKPTDEAKEAADEFGLNLSSATLKAEGLTGVLKKLKKATPEQLSVIFPKVRGMAGFAASLQQVEGQLEDVAFITDSAGRAQEAYNRMTDNARFTFDRFKESVGLVKKEFGEGLTPTIEKYATQAIKWITENKETFKVWGEKVGGWITKVIDYFKAFYKLVKAGKTQEAFKAMTDDIINATKGIWESLKKSGFFEAGVTIGKGLVNGVSQGMDQALEEMSQLKKTLIYSVGGFGLGGPPGAVGGAIGGNIGDLIYETKEWAKQNRIAELKSKLEEKGIGPEWAAERARGMYNAEQRMGWSLTGNIDKLLRELGLKQEYSNEYLLKIEQLLDPNTEW